MADVPYNDDPDAVTPLPGVADALDRARRAGLKVGIVTNQRGVALGRISPERLEAVHARVEALLGPFDVVAWCPHDVFDRCRCRKPGPGLILHAAAQLGVPVGSCLVVGDSWTDIVAAHNAGAMALLVGDGPAPSGSGVTRVSDLAAAVELALGRWVAA